MPPRRRVAAAPATSTTISLRTATTTTTPSAATANRRQTRSTTTAAAVAIAARGGTQQHQQRSPFERILLGINAPNIISIPPPSPTPPLATTTSTNNTVRRSQRLEALRNRDRESEENALRQIRESVAHTHRFVQTTPMPMNANGSNNNGDSGGNVSHRLLMTIRNNGGRPYSPPPRAHIVQASRMSTAGGGMAAYLNATLPLPNDNDLNGRHQTSRVNAGNDRFAIYSGIGRRPRQTARMSTGGSASRARDPLPTTRRALRHALVRQNAIRRRGGRGEDDIAGPSSILRHSDDQVFRLSLHPLRRSESSINLQQHQPSSSSTSATASTTATNRNNASGGGVANNSLARMRVFTSINWPASIEPRDRNYVMFEGGNGGNVRERLLDIGLFLGAHNRYSSDSEDSFFQPRVIDPDAISEDESDDDSTEIRELSPPNVPSPPPEPTHRPVTRSMSRQPTFYDQPASSSSAAAALPPRPRPIIKKKNIKSGLCKLGKAGANANIKKIIKVEKVTACSICFEDEPKKPVACVYCRQSIGCRHCVKKWFFTTNMSHLDQRTPYPIGGTDRNHKRCPLCRADWGDSMQIVSAVEKDSLLQQKQKSNPLTTTSSTTNNMPLPEATCSK